LQKEETHVEYNIAKDISIEMQHMHARLLAEKGNVCGRSELLFLSKS